MPSSLDAAQWIARTVPASTRIVRSLACDRIDWAEPGHTLGQTFESQGPVTAVNLNLAAPRDAADAYTADVRYTVRLRDAADAIVAEQVFDGPQLVWDYFGILLDVTPPAPAGTFSIELDVERETIGWFSAEPVASADDDGISPLPVRGVALADGQRVPGVRMIGVDTIPAPNPVFRHTFELGTAPESATLDAAVLGVGAVYLNDVRVGDEALEPAVTDYDRTVLFRSWDVTHLLRAGDNSIRIEAGRERYSARGGDVWGWSLAPWHREPVASARLDIDEGGGRSRVVVTDGTWESAAGPVVADRLFRGEDWVWRATPLSFEPVAVVSAPAGVLRPATHPPVRALAPIPAVVVEQLDARRTVYDFGAVMVGRVRARISGEPGARVRVISGEQRGPDGEVVCDNFLVAGEAQLDTLLLERAADGETWEPRFGYRGFRWMQIETVGEVTVDEVRAVPLYAELETVGEFTADEPVVEWIDTVTARTFRNNFHGIPTDTPIYEKNGWTADAHLATEGLLHHFDLRAAFGKWINDHIDAQATDGAIPWIVPTPGWGRESDPTWSSSAVLIPWYLYREYGDREILERSADMIRRLADNVLSRLGDGVWTHRTWGDWLSPGYHVGPEGMAPIGTAMTVTLLQHTAAVLGELGKPDAAHYDSEAARVGALYHAAYFDGAAGVYAVPGVPYRQVLNILPLAFGIVPEREIARVREGLIDDIEQRTDGHLDTGAVGVRHLLGVLSDAGRDDLALTVLTRRTPPSWGAWFDAGESTLLESWEADSRSRNHYFLGSVSAWIQQRIGALRAIEPGWSRFEIAPIDDARVSRARMRHRTPRGDAAVAWQRGAGGWRFEVEVPIGATAIVRASGAAHELAAGVHVVYVPSTPQ